MIIEKIEPIALRLPFPEECSSDTAAAGAANSLNLVFCKVTTRSGIEGFGECLCVRPGIQKSLVATIIDMIAPVYLGQSVDRRIALNLEVRRRYAPFGRAGTILNALAAVDIALWDIAGKASGQSLATMLGGVKKTSVPMMANITKLGGAALVTERLLRARSAGVAAVKIHEADLTIIEESRRAIGPAMPFVADVNNAHTLVEIQQKLVRWQALDLMWLEDPVWPPEAMLTCPKIAGLAIGLGADSGSVEQLFAFAETPAVDFIQPDVCMIGGVTEAAKALQRKRRPGLKLAPHTPFTGPAALASLQLLATLEESAYFAMIESPENIDLYGMGMHRWAPAISIPSGPGLGFDPDPVLMKRFEVFVG